MAKFRITNFGNTRKFPYKGQFYEISKNCSIETDDEQLAKEFDEFPFVDCIAIEQEKESDNTIDKKIKRRKN